MLRFEDAFLSFLFSPCVSQFVCLSSMEADIFPIHCSLLSTEDQKEREKEKRGGGGHKNGVGKNNNFLGFAV